MGDYAREVSTLSDISIRVDGVGDAALLFFSWITKVILFMINFIQWRH